MQSVSFRIWTRVAVSISCDDNHYNTGTSCSGWYVIKLNQTKRLTLSSGGGERTDGCVPFLMAFAWSEIQTALSRIQILDLTSNNKHYVKCWYNAYIYPTPSSRAGGDITSFFVYWVKLIFLSRAVVLLRLKNLVCPTIHP